MCIGVVYSPKYGHAVTTWPQVNCNLKVSLQGGQYSHTIKGSGTWALFVERRALLRCIQLYLKKQTPNKNKQQKKQQPCIQCTHFLSSSGTEQLFRNAAMFAECTAAAVLHTYYLRTFQTNRGGAHHWCNGTAVFWYGKHGCAVSARALQLGVVAVVFPRACICMCVYIDWCSVWQDAHSKDQTGSHQLDFFSLSHKPQG